MDLNYNLDFSTFMYDSENKGYTETLKAHRRQIYRYFFKELLFQMYLILKKNFLHFRNLYYIISFYLLICQLHYEEKYLKCAFKKVKHFSLVKVTIVVGNNFRESVTEKQNKNEEWKQMTVHIFFASNKNILEGPIYQRYIIGNL